MNLTLQKSQFEKFIQSQGDEPQTTINHRQDAFNKFLKIGYPTKNHENWRFTNLTALSKTEYQFLNRETDKIYNNVFDEYYFDNCHRIVFVNGIYHTELSTLNEIAKHVSVKNIKDSDSVLKQNSAMDDSNPFILLNSALISGGYSIIIDSNYVAKKPLHILNIISTVNDKVQHHQHNMIKIGKNSQVSIVEENVSTIKSKLFENTVSNIQVDDNSKLSHTLLQKNYVDETNINHIFVEQQANSTYKTQLVNIGGELLRNDIDVQINGENCCTDISGLSLLSGKDHIENYTVINHNKPNSNSKQLFKYILDETSEGVFNGLVSVKPDAQKTDSQQTNKNILLSKKAVMNSNPQLEIYADDVKCSHGSATGELDEDSIFYLRSRGIDLATAKSLLIEGFAKEVIDKIDIKSVKERLNIEILKRLVS